MRIAALLLLLFVVPAAAQLDRNLVHNVFSVDAQFAEWEAAHPELIERITIGQSEGGFPLHGIIVTDESVPFDDPPHTATTKWRVYLDGGHHGNEFLGVEIALYYVESLLDRHAAGDADVHALLASTEIQVVPILNVEGNLRDTRINLNGVDPNRNYDFGHTPCPIPLGLKCGGPEPFSESEVRANAEHVTAISPDLWLSMHTGIEVLYYPAGDPFVPAAADQALFDAMEGPFEAAAGNRIDMVGGPAPAVGSAEDWGYAVLGVQSFVYEVHNDQNLPIYGQPITDLLQDQLNGMAWLVEGAPKWGAWVEAVPHDDGVVFENRGLAMARDVTVHIDGDERALPEIMPGATSKPVALGASGDVAWRYPVLLVESSRIREHAATFPGAPAADERAPAGALAPAAVGAAFLLRRRT